jgi:hypothetical protein
MNSTIKTVYALAIAAVLSMAAGSVVAAPSAELWERWDPHDAQSTATIDHELWNDFLSRYLSPNIDGINRFEYSAVKQIDLEPLESYIAKLSDIEIRLYNRNEQRAFWINLYNALTVREILYHYPVSSIREIRSGFFTSGPWQKVLVEVESTALKLDDIEHRILRPLWRDPRLHYAVNCAALGCPNLQSEAFNAGNTERLLELGAREFINHPRAVTVTYGKLRVSSIYDWFEEDFGGSELAVIEHLKVYAKPELLAEISTRTRIDGDFYDWALNGKIFIAKRSRSGS